MVVRSFNVSEDIYGRFLEFCKARGVSMSKQIEMFMRAQVSDELEIKKEYLDRLAQIRKGKYLNFKSLDELRDHIENA
ncbi:MAG: hypothetical protein ABH834_03820 [Candidatus Altiarchaeota archaeon]